MQDGPHILSSSPLSLGKCLRYPWGNSCGFGTNLKGVYHGTTKSFTFWVAIIFYGIINYGFVIEIYISKECFIF